MRTISEIIGAGALVLALAQCGSDSKQDPATAPGGCIPASVRRCQGPWSCNGQQVCSADGTQWSECGCPPTAPSPGDDAGTGHDAGYDVSRVAEVGAPDLAPDGPPVQYVLLDDMESSVAVNGPISFLAAAGNAIPGSWSSWRSSGSPANTMAPEPYAYSPLPAPHQTMEGVTSTRAAHLTCHIADRYGYCEQGLWLAQGLAPSDGNPGIDPASAGASDMKDRIPVDLSAYHGLVFWALANKTSRLKVLVENAETDALGGRCGHADASTDQCGDAFSKQVSLSDTWKRYEVKWSELLQQGWGHAAPGGKLDTRTVYLIGFQIDGPQSSAAAAVDIDFWVDDIYFE